MSDIRTRIAPSPTGFLHIGTARTALFNYLFSLKHKGTFVMRIEDTDLERSEKHFEKDIFKGFEWLGIEAHESPIRGGPYAPYRQSERTASYISYAEKLLREGKAFYCFHSEAELEEEKQQLIEAKKPYLHLCEFRNLDPKEADMLKDAKPSHVIRFKTPAGRTISFTDLIRGEVIFESDLLGDFSIAKRIDAPLYHFAVVIDDFEMRISHVIRGEDHIANTPKHMLLIEALGFPQPQYAHLPLILGTDRSKLSKRHGATSIVEYQEMGYLPDALFNFIALLGWNPGTDQELFSREELINAFSLEHVQKSGAIFDLTKLEWMNGEYIRRKSVSELSNLCIPFLIKAGLLSDEHIKKEKRVFVEAVVALEQPRLKKLSEIAEKTDFFFNDPLPDRELLRWKSMTDEELRSALARSHDILSRFSAPLLKDEIEKFFFAEIGGGDKGSVLWPLRVALTGKKASPGPFEIIAILGVREAIKRVEAAQQLC